MGHTFTFIINGTTAKDDSGSSYQASVSNAKIKLTSTSGPNESYNIDRYTGDFGFWWNIDKNGDSYATGKGSCQSTKKAIE
jgi:hypothetical protein